MIFASIKRFFTSHINQANVAKAKAQFQKFKQYTTPNVRAGTKMGTPPLAFGGGGGAVRSAGRIVQAIRNVGQRALGNPLAGRTIGQLGRVIGGRALGTGLFLGALELTAGNTFKPSTIARTIAGAALNPIGAIFGTSFRIGRGAVTGATNIAKDIIPDSFGGFVPEFRGNFYGGATNIQFPPMQTPLGSSFTGGLTGGYGSSFAPSVNVGGGSDITPLILALLGGATGGYLLGRRKKKRYKKKRKR